MSVAGLVTVGVSCSSTLSSRDGGMQEHILGRVFVSENERWGALQAG